MDSLRKIFFITISLIIPFQIFSQDITSKDSIRTKYINTAKEIMNNSGNCALITLDKEGRPRVRVMDPFSPEEDLTVWLGTNPKSRKVDQIRNDPRVSLYYYDQDAVGYVMIEGIAQLVDDIKEKETRWKANWDAFYPNRNEDYLLIKIIPNWMEVISYKHGIMGDSITWKPPIINIKQE